MRTKNLNLKKKIAFIASVAMIATTAAYLPAEVTKNIGGIEVNAYTGKAGDAIYADTGLALGKKQAAAKINTFNAYLKINNKYLAKGTGDNAGKFKYYNNCDTTTVKNAATDGWDFVTLNTRLGGYLDAAQGSETINKNIWTDYFTPLKDTNVANGTFEGNGDAEVKNEEIYIDSDSVEPFMLPSDTPVGAEITVEIVPNTVASGNAAADADAKFVSVIKSAEKEVSTTLDDNGLAVVTSKTKIEVAGSDVKYAADNKTPDEGNYETVSLYGLKFEVAPTAGTKLAIQNNAIDVNGVDTNNTSDAVATKTNLQAQTLINAGTEVKEYERKVVKSGNVYATNIVYQLNNTRLQANDTLEIAFDPTGINTISGGGYNNKKMTLVMGSEGYVSSGLVTVKTTGSADEHYIITIVNQASALTANKIKVSKFVDLNAKALNADLSAGLTKVKVDTKAEVTGDGTKFVDTYTIMGNSRVKTYAYKTYTAPTGVGTAGYAAGGVTALDAESATKKHAIEVDLDAAFKEAADGEGKGTGTGGAFVKVLFADESTNEAKSPFVSRESGKVILDRENAKLYIAPGENKGGNFTTPVIKVMTGGTAVAPVYSYFKLAFTTSYKIPYYNTESDGATKAKAPMGYAEVTNGTVVTNPGTAEVGGFTFKGWEINSNVNIAGGTDYSGTSKSLFSTDSTAQQLGVDDTTTTPFYVTPNSDISAVYEANTFNVKYDANGGYIDDVDGYTTVDTKQINNNGTVTTKAASIQTSAELTADQNTAAGDETKVLTDVSATTVNNTVVRNGYTFKGWAAKADATEELTRAEYVKLRPNEKHGSITLYAVWEANDVTLTFRCMNIDDTSGASASGSLATDYVENANGFVSNRKSATYTAGKAYGTLPTPTLKGYTFDGWYVENISENAEGKTIYKAVKVTETSLIDSDYIAAGNTQTLWAKFVQNKYNITNDYDGGKLIWGDAVDPAVKDEYDDPTELEIASYKFNASNNAAQKVVFFNANGDNVTTKLTDGTFNVVKGSGTYNIFKGFTINGGSSKVEFAELANTVAKSLTTLSDLTFKASYETTKADTLGSFFFDTNEGDFYFKDAAAPVAGSTGDTVNAMDPIYTENNGNIGKEASEGTKVNSIYTVKDDTVEYGGDKYVVARPGYTFTGWYADKACTTKFDFNAAEYSVGKELAAYAGWKANTTTRYKLNFSVLDENGAVVIDDDNTKANHDSDAGEYPYTLTFMGTTGNTADASKLTVTINKVKYVFDPVLSASSTTTKEIKAKYLDIADTAATAADERKGLSAGVFAQDADEYTTIQGVYVVEGSQHEEPTAELGNATNVKGTANGDKVTISFKAADNAVKYQVAKIVNGKTYYSAKTDATSIDITPASVDYQVYVIAFDKDGKSTHSETIKLTGVKKYNLGTVMDPVATEKLEADGTKTVTISWSKAENAAWYKVFKIVNGKKYWGKKVTDTSYVLKNIPATDSYIVYVAAGDDKGHVTYGARKKVSKFPSVTNVTLAPDKKTVTFDAAEGAVKYQVAKIEENNKVNYSAKSTTTSITLKNAFKAGQKYYVLAFFEKDGKTYSSYSDTFEVK